MERIVGIIPARYESQRLPGKPLADIGGKPMIQHVYERAAQARTLDWCLVATDDERIVSAVRDFGGHVVLTPDNLQTGTDRVAFVARSLPNAGIIVNVQGDEPLIEPGMIDEAVRCVTSHADVGVGTLVREIENSDDLANPGIVKVVLDSERNCLYFSRSAIPFSRDGGNVGWLSHHHYYKHIGLYVYRRDFLLRLSEMSQTPLELTEQLEQLRILEHGYRIKAAVTQYDSIPVDTRKDLERIRTLIGATT
jgi:3-deoxy-manno-octulosonate cytidylyltransferase (CMP-KDO synthetase)